MNTIDDAKREIDQFLKSYESFKNEDLSESDTRSKVIDYVLTNVLGWEEINIKREEHGDNGYYDYKLSLAGFSFVIEAKKQFVDFVIPNSRKRRCKLDSIYEANKEVINQIRGYLDDQGCDFGVITNGKQYIIAKFRNSDGTSWKSNDCIIYKNIGDVAEHIVEFWNDLSRESVSKNCGIGSLKYKPSNFSKTILSTIIDKENEISRNDLAVKWASIISTILGTIFSNESEEDNVEFIKACYVENNEIKKNKSELNRLFCDEAPLFSSVIKAKNHNSIKSQIKDEISQYAPQSVSSPTPQPIIIIGSKGVGKTTFINYLFKYDLENSIISQSPYVYINLMKYYSGEETLDLDAISKDVIEEISGKFVQYDIDDIKTLKRIYIKEINSLKKGVWACYANDEKRIDIKISEFIEEKLKNHREHLKGLNLYFTREIHKRIILIFDNADQLSDAVQKQLFLFAGSLNIDAKYGVIISLREGYFYKWKNLPPFNAYDSNVYHITTPNYVEVLKKRIEYCINTVNFCKTFGEHYGKDIELSGDRVSEFFESVKSTLFSSDSSPIIDYMNYTTYPNIREGLQLFKKFLLSGYNDVYEYIKRILFDSSKGAKKYIPIHEFIQTIALENNLYYNHETSEVSNLFYPESIKSDYFIKIYLLLYLNEIFDKQGRLDKYVAKNQVADDFIAFGYEGQIIDEEINMLIKKRFVETEAVLSDVDSKEESNVNTGISISSKGKYYLFKMINRFYYVDLVLQDTPIYDRDVFTQLVSIFPKRDKTTYKRDIIKRVEVVQCFMKYLESIENNVVPTSLILKYGKISEFIYSHGLNNDIDRICSKDLMGKRATASKQRAINKISNNK